jgi:hypothetical protein
MARTRKSLPALTASTSARVLRDGAGAVARSAAARSAACGVPRPSMAGRRPVCSAARQQIGDLAGPHASGAPGDAPIGASGAAPAGHAKLLWRPKLSADTLVLADRGFYGFKLWQSACATGAKLLWRVKAKILLPVQPSYRLMTNLLQAQAAPALELAALYHERWEAESVFDELKTHLHANSTVLRSKTPELVEQELWGLLLAHFAIRQLMVQAAWPSGLDPDRLSFTHALRVIKRKMPQAAAVPP